MATFAAIAAAPLGAAASPGAAAPGAASPSTAAVPSAWQQTNADAALSRANHSETTLTRRTVKHASLLLNLPAPANGATCSGPEVRSPILKSGRIFDIANGEVNMYVARTGLLGWSATPDSDFDTILLSLSVGHGLVVVAGLDCQSQSDPNGVIYAYSTTTGALVWSTIAAQTQVGPLSELVETGPYLVQTGASAGSGLVTAVYQVSDGQQLWIQRGFAADCGPVIVVHNLLIRSVCDSDTGAAPLEADSVTTGLKVWSRPGIWQISRGSDQGPDGHIYATRTRNLDGEFVTSAPRDLDASTGATRFELTGSTNILAADNFHVYAQCGVTAHICAYSEATGALQWHVVDHSTLAGEAAGALYLSNGRVLKTSNGQLVTNLWHGTATDIAIGDGRAAVVDSPHASTPATGLDVYGIATTCRSAAHTDGAVRCKVSRSAHPAVKNCC